MRSQFFISLVLVLVGGDRRDGAEKASAVMLEKQKSLLGKEKKADEGSVVAGPYKTELRSYTYKGMNATSSKIDVWYPVGVADQKFPLISYAHGATYGGPNTVIKYGQLLDAMASFGYVIAAHESCSTGCLDGTSLPNEGPGFGTMYKEQLKVIEWAKQQGTHGEAVFNKSVNFDIGVGISGHSMGGQATVYSSSSHGAGHGIKAAVMHNAHTHTYPAPIVPFLVFTGTEDTTPSYMGRAVFDAKGANSIRGFVNKRGGDHLMPQEEWRELAMYTVAWFKLFLDEIRQDDTFDYEAMIFGTSNSSLCHGGFGAMAVCEVHDGSVASEGEQEVPSGASRAWWSGLTVLACAVTSGMGTSRVSATRG